MSSFRFAAVSAFAVVIAACSPSSSSEDANVDATEEASAAADLATSADAPPVVPGPPRLHLSCLLGDRPSGTTDVIAPGQDGGIYLGMIHRPADYASVSISMSSDPPYTVTLSTERNHAWMKGSVSSVVVTQTVADPGDKVVLSDASIIPDTPVTCTATLASQPTVTTFATKQALALEALTTPRFHVTIPLPNRLSCGVALKLAAPVDQKLVDDLPVMLDVEGSEKVVTTLDDEHTIAFRMPASDGWSAELSLEAHNHTTALDVLLRGFLSQPPAPGAIGTFETIACPAH